MTKRPYDLTEGEEDLYFNWIFDHDGDATEERLKAEGYKWIYIAPNGAPKIDVPRVIVTGELERGDLVFTKRLLLKEIGPNLKPVTIGTQNEADVQKILDFYEEHGGDIVLTQPAVGGIFAALVHPATREGVAWQGSKFDQHGPFGHVEAQSIDHAVRRLVEDGFRTPDPMGMQKVLGARANPPYSGYDPRYAHRKLPKDQDRVAYSRKRDALNVFLLHNSDVVDRVFHGPGYKGHGFEAFENFNRAFDLKGKRRVNTLAKAAWWAYEPARDASDPPPWYIEDIDIDLLNNTDRMQQAWDSGEYQGPGFTLPDSIEAARLAEEEAEYYAGLYSDDDGEVPF